MQHGANSIFTNDAIAGLPSYYSLFLVFETESNNVIWLIEQQTFNKLLLSI